MWPIGRTARKTRNYISNCRKSIFLRSVRVTSFTICNHTMDFARCSHALSVRVSILRVRSLRKARISSSSSFKVEEKEISDDIDDEMLGGLGKTS